MTYVKIGDQQLPARITGLTRDPAWDNRASKSISCEMTHAEAAELFVNDAAWSIIYQAPDTIDDSGNAVTPEPVEYDNSDYCVAGDITDHRDGTITVKMGKLTDTEEILGVLYGV